MNNRKKVLLAASVLTLVLFVIYRMVWVDNYDMKVQVLSPEKAEEFKSRLTDVTGTEVKVTLSFEGENLPYYSAKNCFYLPLSMESEAYENGVFEVRIDGEEAELFFFEDFTEKEKSEWMKNNVMIPAMAVKDNRYVNLNLTLTGTSLIEFASTEFVTAENLPVFEMTVYDASSKKEWVSKCYTTSTLRGNTSLSYDKKSLRLKLKEQKEDGTFEKVNRNLLGLRDDDDWILNSLYADDAKIKDKLANELWNEAGANSNPYGKTFGTDMEYVEVFMDGGYMGLYGLMYPIDRKQIGTEAVSKQLAAGENVIERLYKKKYTGEWNADDFVGALPDPKMPDYRGGYYVKGDTILQDESEWAPLYELAACIEADDATFEANITKLTDKQNVLENWLFYQAVAGFDNYAKNYYYIVKNKGDLPYGYFIPWDLNLTFGDVYRDNEYYAAHDETVVRDIIPWEPAWRMLELDVEDSREIIKTTWQKWREDVFDTENVLMRMDEIYHELIQSGAYLREQSRWPEGRYTEDLTDIKRFTRERLEFVDAYVEGL